MKVAIIIASKGRPEELGRWVDHIARQTIQPVVTVMSVTSKDDLPAVELPPTIVPVICNGSGTCHQRNAGLSAVAGQADIVAFFDDDYIPSSRCIEGVERLFGLLRTVDAATGTLLADGINSAGIPYEEALAIAIEHDNEPDAPISSQDLSGVYGCNMAFRAKAIGADRFDERLAMYGWQEDIDFAARVGRQGRIVKTNAFAGVHQGVKGARQSGVLLGYSQIANPLYLIRKGTMRRTEALALIIKNVAKNHLRALYPEPWIDRLGRCKGNWRALVDVVLGRDDPAKILELSKLSDGRV
jgi:hypothetical protein